MSETPPPPAWSLRKRLARGLVLTAMLPMVLFAAILLVSEWQRNRDELMRRLSVPEGPEIGRILRELRTECALGRHGTKEEVLERGAALLSSKNTHTE